MRYRYSEIDRQYERNQRDRSKIKELLARDLRTVSEDTVAQLCG